MIPCHKPYKVDIYININPILDKIFIITLVARVIKYVRINMHRNKMMRTKFAKYNKIIEKRSWREMRCDFYLNNLHNKYDLNSM